MDKNLLSRLSASVALVCASVFTVASAQDAGAKLDPAQAGIAMYPGAKPDAAASAFVREQLKMTGSAWRTSDDVAKVAAFYEKQGKVSKLPGANREQAAFSAGCKDEYNPYMKKNMQRCGYQVTIQNPWMDMKTGQMVNDTLITIVKQ